MRRAVCNEIMILPKVEIIATEFAPQHAPVTISNRTASRSDAFGVAPSADFLILLQSPAPHGGAGSCRRLDARVPLRCTTTDQGARLPIKQTVELLAAGQNRISSHILLDIAKNQTLGKVIPNSENDKEKQRCIEVSIKNIENKNEQFVFRVITE